MGKTESPNTQTIDTELTNDLHFQVLELKRLFELTKSVLQNANAAGIPEVERYVTYVHNLRSRIETLSYDAIFHLRAKDKDLILNYRALIRVSVNLKVISDYLVQAARQVEYLQNPEIFEAFPLERFFDVTEETLELIHLGFTEVDTDLAESICASEKKLDELYLNYFEQIQEELPKKSKSADMLTLLFIIRYFERIGDCFLKIGEGILNISIGDALNIRHYRNLEAVVKDLTPKKAEASYDFKPFLFSRSGCKVGRLLIETNESEKQRLFYKQGDSKKIKDEIVKLKQWEKKFPNTVPAIKWQQHNGDGSTLVVNYLQGENLLNYVLKKGSKVEVEEATQVLTQRLTEIWSKEKVKKTSSSGFVKQILKRKKAIEHVHEDFFEAFKSGNGKEKIDFAKALKEAEAMEKKVKTTFQVWCHGDFNLDNIIYHPKNKTVSFIDVHRSGYNDYVQEISVFMVSMLRIQSADKPVKEKTRILVKAMYAFGKQFAESHKDKYFDARLAFGLFRSLVTSTRFLQDDEWYHQLRMWAWGILQSLEKEKKDLKKYTFSPELILN